MSWMYEPGQIVNRKVIVKCDVFPYSVEKAVVRKTYKVLRKMLGS